MVVGENSKSAKTKIQGVAPTDKRPGIRLPSARSEDTQKYDAYPFVGLSIATAVSGCRTKSVCISSHAPVRVSSSKLVWSG